MPGIAAIYVGNDQHSCYSQTMDEKGDRSSGEDEELIIIEDQASQRSKGSQEDRENMYRYLSALTEQDQLEFAMQASIKGNLIPIP